jgi:hypothetical protein
MLTTHLMGWQVFVSIDEHTKISDLAATLNVDLQLVKACP